jgi:K+-transporting ATPase ATPase C chain
MQSLITSLRLAVATMLVCVGGYTALILGIAQVVAKDTADGSLIARADGGIAGSRLLAQAFTKPGYFWPRPSAVGYNAAGAGGSNKSPTSEDLTKRAQEIVAEYGATSGKPLPAELAAASGGGLDPHVSERGAVYQVERVAKARRRPPEDIEALVHRLAFAPGGFMTRGRVVNVLELNLALDGLP